MKSYIFGAAIALLLTACASDTEQKGLDYIAQIYDGNASYSKSVETNLGQETMKKFNVKLSGSKMIDSLKPTVSTANIALLMYQSFTPEEQKNYTHIDVELVNAKNDTVSYYYPTEVMQGIDKKALSFHRFSESLIEGDYRKLDILTDKSHIPGSIAKAMQAEIEKYEKVYGNLLSYEPFGLAEEKHPKGAFYQFQGNLQFEDGTKVPYFVVVLTAPDNNQVVGFKVF